MQYERMALFFTVLVTINVLLNGRSTWATQSHVLSLNARVRINSNYLWALFISGHIFKKNMGIKHSQSKNASKDNVYYHDVYSEKSVKYEWIVSCKNKIHELTDYLAIFMPQIFIKINVNKIKEFDLWGGNWNECWENRWLK
jgi:hypothetical protein